MNPWATSIYLVQVYPGSVNCGTVLVLFIEIVFTLSTVSRNLATVVVASATGKVSLASFPGPAQLSIALGTRLGFHHLTS